MAVDFYIRIVSSLKDWDEGALMTGRAAVRGVAKGQTGEQRNNHHGIY